MSSPQSARYYQAMVNSRQWWDDFWQKNAAAPVSGPRACPTWYDLVWKMSFEHWHGIFQRLAPGKKMLECGCGSARVSQYMNRRGYDCTLLDYSQPALYRAKSAFGSPSLRARFIRGDINRLCLADSSFDIVYSGGVLEFFDDADTPIREMTRILKPGGVFAANIVPDKFSIQTIADIERTLACSARNLFRGRFRDVFKRIRHLHPDYRVNSLRLDDYVAACKKAGLTSVAGLVSSPFPVLSLPRFAEEMYAGLMERCSFQWRAFDKSRSRWKDLWGIAYTIYGIKK